MRPEPSPPVHHTSTPRDTAPRSRRRSLVAAVVVLAGGLVVAPQPALTAAAPAPMIIGAAFTASTDEDQPVSAFIIASDADLDAIIYSVSIPAGLGIAT